MFDAIRSDGKRWVPAPDGVDTVISGLWLGSNESVEWTYMLVNGVGRIVGYTITDTCAVEDHAISSVP